MTQTAQPRPLTLRGALADLGWFSVVFSALVSGPSVLALLQMVFVEHRLIDALQWIVDGYKGIAAIVGAALEPAIAAAVAFVNAFFDWRLELHAHWKPLFLLTAVMATAGAREAWRERKQYSGHVFALAGLGLGALVGAAAAGLAPLDGRWWMQGLAAAAPLGLAFLGMTLAFLGVTIFVRVQDAFALTAQALVVGFLFAALAFLLGAGMSFVPGLSRGAGVLSVAITMVAFAVANLASGLARTDRYLARAGLTMLGGFVTAGMIVAADALVKLLI